MAKFKLIFASVLICISGVATAAVVERIVAVVDDEVITESELDLALAQMYAKLKESYDDEELAERYSQAKRQALQQIIDDKLLLREASKQGIAASENEIEARLQEIRGKFTNEEELKEALEANSVTLEDLKTKYKEQLMIRNLISREVSSKIFVSPQEVSGYYDAHRSEYSEPESVRVYSILIRISDTLYGEDALKKAQDIAKLLNGAVSFEEAAKRYSEGPHKNEGGDLGYVKRGDMIKELDETIFSLKSDEVSNPIKTKLGYHIIKVGDRRLARHRDLSEVKSQIEGTIFNEKAQKRFAEYMAKLRKGAYISIK